MLNEDNQFNNTGFQPTETQERFTFEMETGLLPEHEPHDLNNLALQPTASQGSVEFEMEIGLLPEANHFDNSAFQPTATQGSFPSGMMEGGLLAENEANLSDNIAFQATEPRVKFTFEELQTAAAALDPPYIGFEADDAFPADYSQSGMPVGTEGFTSESLESGMLSDGFQTNNIVFQPEAPQGTFTFEEFRTGAASNSPYVAFENGDGYIDLPDYPQLDEDLSGPGATSSGPGAISSGSVSQLEPIAAEDTALFEELGIAATPDAPDLAFDNYDGYPTDDYPQLELSDGQGVTSLGSGFRPNSNKLDNSTFQPIAAEDTAIFEELGISAARDAPDAEWENYDGYPADYSQLELTGQQLTSLGSGFRHDTNLELNNSTCTFQPNTAEDTAIFEELGISAADDAPDIDFDGFDGYPADPSQYALPEEGGAASLGNGVLLEADQLDFDAFQPTESPQYNSTFDALLPDAPSSNSPSVDSSTALGSPASSSGRVSQPTVTWENVTSVDAPPAPPPPMKNESVKHTACGTDPDDPSFSSHLGELQFESPNALGERESVWLSAYCSKCRDMAFHCSAPECDHFSERELYGGVDYVDHMTKHHKGILYCRSFYEPNGPQCNVPYRGFSGFSLHQKQGRTHWHDPSTEANGGQKLLKCNLCDAVFPAQKSTKRSEHASEYHKERVETEFDGILQYKSDADGGSFHAGFRRLPSEQMSIGCPYPECSRQSKRVIGKSISAFVTHILFTHDGVLRCNIRIVGNGKVCALLYKNVRDYRDHLKFNDHHTDVHSRCLGCDSVFEEPLAFKQHQQTCRKLFALSIKDTGRVQEY